MRKSLDASVRSGRSLSSHRKTKLAMAAFAALATGQARGQSSLWWDTNGATPGASVGTTATGTWDNSTANWTTDSTGASPTTTWTGPNTAMFAAGSNATGAYTVTVAAGTTIANVAGITIEEGTLTLAAGDSASTLGLTGNTTFSNGTTLAINAILSGSGASLTKIGGGSLNLAAVDTYTGGTTLSAGLLQLNGAAGALTGTSGMFLAQGSAFVIDNSGGAVQNRLNDAAGITNNGANLVMAGNATAGVTETVGVLSSTSINVTSLITMTTAAGGTTDIKFSSLQQSPGSLMVFRGTGLGKAAAAGAAQILFTTAPTLSGGTPGVTSGTNAQIILGALGDITGGSGSDFVTYDPTLGIRELAATDYSGTLNEGQSNGLVNPSALTAFTIAGSNTTATALKLSFANTATNPGLALSTNSNLLLTDGSIIANTTAQTITGGTITLGANGTILPATALTINSNLVAPSGFIKAGSGLLTLGGSNNIGGTINWYTGSLTLTSSGALGGNGQLIFSPNASASVMTLTDGVSYTPEAVVLSGGGTSITGGQMLLPSGNATWGGTIITNGTTAGTVQSTTGIGVGAGATLTVSGNLVSEPGATPGSVSAWWVKTGPGNLLLTGNNTWAGTVRANNGGLVFGSPTAMGADTQLGQISGLNGIILENTTTGANQFVAFQSTPGTGQLFSANMGQPGYRLMQIIGPAGTNGVGTSNGNPVSPLDNLSGNNTFAGDIELGFGPSTNIANNSTALIGIGVTAGSLELSGKIYSSLVSTSTAPGAVSQREIIKTGTGELIISGQNDGNDSEPITGGVILATGGFVQVSAGTMTLAGPNGQLQGALEHGVTENNPFNWQINPGAALQFDQSRGFLANRISAVATAQVASFGDFKVNGSASSSITQNLSDVGTILTGQGASFTVTTPTGAAPGVVTLLNAGNINSYRPGLSGIVTLRGITDATGNAQIHIDDVLVGTQTADPASTPIVPYLLGTTASTGAGTDFVTKDANGIARPLTATDYTPISDGTQAMDNTLVTADTGLTQNTLVNSIKIPAASTVASISIPSGVTLTVNAGGILNLSNASALTIGDGTAGHGTLAVNSEGDFTFHGDTTISANILANNGLVIDNGGTLTLSGTNNQINGLALLGGTVAISNLSQLGSGTLALGTTLKYTGASASTSLPINIASVSGTTIDVPASTNLTFAGTINSVPIQALQSQYPLVKTNSGTLTLTGNNTYQGDLDVNGGTVIMTGSNSGAIGQNVINAGGTLSIDNESNLNDGNVTLTNGTLNILGTTAAWNSLHNWKLGGSIDNVVLNNGVKVTIQNGTNAFNTISGAAEFHLTGNGTLIVGQQGSQNSYTGGTVIDGPKITLDYEVNASGVVTNGLPSNAAPATAGIGYWTLTNGGTIKYNLTSATGQSNSSFDNGTRGLMILAGSTSNTGIVDVTSGNLVGNGAYLSGAANTLFIKTDEGTYRLDVAANFSGTAQVMGGILAVNSATALQNATLDYNNYTDTVSTGQLAFTSVTAATIGALQGSENLTLMNSVATPAAVALTVGNNNSSTSYTGALSGGGSVTKNGTGNMTFSGANTFTGGTNVAAGTLTVGATNTLPTTGTITVKGGTLALGANSQNAGVVTLQGGTISGSTGVLTATSYAAQTGTASAILAGGAFAKTTTGTVTLSGANTFTGGVNITAGTLVVSSDANLGDAANNVTVAAATLASTGSFSTSRNVTLGTGVDTISVSTAANTLTIAGTVSGAGALSKAGPGTLVLSSVNNSYSGGTTVNAGTLSISSDANLGAAGSIGLAGGGTLATTAVVNSTRNITVTATNGAISAGAPTTVGAVTGAGTLTANGSSSLTVSGFNLGGVNVTTGSLVLASNGSVAGIVGTGGVTVAAGAVLDLTNNDMILPYVSTSPAAAIRALLVNGYAGGAWNGTGGINSSAAAGDATHLTALGYGEATDVGVKSLDGQTIAGNAAIVKFTYYGDGTLDGKVDLGNDFNLFLQGFLNSNLLTNANRWELGDYNYDGLVNGADFQLFVDGFKSQGNNLGALEGVIASNPELSVAQKASLLSVVPEPSSLALMAVGAFGLTSRRRRKI
jgi:fibronectin-binding autotransporter adhesin